MVSNMLLLSIDVNECATENPCVQTCVNTYGSFICRCDPGYELEEDGVHCSGNGLWHWRLPPVLGEHREGKGCFHRCFLSFPRLISSTETFPRAMWSQLHKTKMSHSLKSGVGPLPCHLTLMQKPKEFSFRVWDGVEEGKKSPNFGCWCELSVLTQHRLKSLDSTDSTYRGQWPRNNNISHRIGLGGGYWMNEIMCVNALWNFSSLYKWSVP